jgi:hypothetical protein
MDEHEEHRSLLLKLKNNSERKKKAIREGWVVELIFISPARDY